MDAYILPAMKKRANEDQVQQSLNSGLLSREEVMTAVRTARRRTAHGTWCRCRACCSLRVQVKRAFRLRRLAALSQLRPELPG